MSDQAREVWKWIAGGLATVITAMVLAGVSYALGQTATLSEALTEHKSVGAHSLADARIAHNESANASLRGAVQTMDSSVRALEREQAVLASEVRRLLRILEKPQQMGP